MPYGTRGGKYKIYKAYGLVSEGAEKTIEDQNNNGDLSTRIGDQQPNKARGSSGCILVCQEDNENRLHIENSKADLP